METKRLFSAILIAVFACLASCANRNGIQQEDVPVLNLMDELAPADSRQPVEHFKQDQPVIRRGLRRNALIVVAPIRIHAFLQGVSGRAVLKGWAAPVFNTGDGINMDLFLRDSGNRRQIGSRYFDPGKKAGDRDWIPLEIPIEIGKEEWLEIEISAGPQGNLTADWLALSEWSLFRGKNR